MRLLFLLLSAAAAHAQSGVTTIQVTGQIQQASVKRMGINLGDQTYYDTGQILKNLVFRNPGFEGMTYRSVIRCGAGSTSTCTDDNEYSNWPAGFWNGASYEFIVGNALGRTGTVTASTAPDPNRQGQGVQLTLGGTGRAVAPGDYVVVRKTFPGDAAAGWWTNLQGGATVATEFNDLPPGSPGQQCIRLNANSNGQAASLISYFDSLENRTFVRLNGAYRITFKARLITGSRALQVSAARSTRGLQTYVDRRVNLSDNWDTYAVDFEAREDLTSTGTANIQFTAQNSIVLLDDVSLVQTDGDPANTTAFRDPVVRALRNYSPGILRYMASGTGLGDAFENVIAPPFARKRPGYSAWSQKQEDAPYGLHEFLELCELVNAEPWWVVPIGFSAAEARNLIEYLAGAPDTPYGARRAARGRTTPWTSAFPRIHLELGNEPWNSVFKGASLERPREYGSHATAIFQSIRTAPGFSPGRFNLIIGGQAVWAGRSEESFVTSAAHDALSVAPYLLYDVDRFANNEELFGPLFAEPQAMAANGIMRDNYNATRNAHRQSRLAVYEVHLHTTGGSISQAALDALAPSQGAGLAVAHHMLHMLRELGVRDQALFTLPQYFFRRGDGKTVKLWGAVLDMGVTDRRRPVFLNVKLANEAIFGDLLRTVHSGADPSWDQPKVNNIELRGAKYIHSYAFAQANVRSLILVNLHRTQALPVNFSGQAPQGRVLIRQIAPSAITDNNETANNVAISTQEAAQFNANATLSLPPFSMTVLSWTIPGAGFSGYESFSALPPAKPKTPAAKPVPTRRRLRGQTELSPRLLVLTTAHGR